MTRPTLTLLALVAAASLWSSCQENKYKPAPLSQQRKQQASEAEAAPKGDTAKPLAGPSVNEPVEAKVPQEKAAPPPMPARLEGKEAAARGKKLFATYECFKCHKVKGFIPSSGPILTKVGRKLTAEKMRTWILDPKALKPNTTMPRFVGPDEDLEYLIDYLETLR